MEPRNSPTYFLIGREKDSVGEPQRCCRHWERKVGGYGVTGAKRQRCLNKEGVPDVTRDLNEMEIVGDFDMSYVGDQLYEGARCWR